MAAAEPLPPLELDEGNLAVLGRLEQLDEKVDRLLVNVLEIHGELARLGAVLDRYRPLLDRAEQRFAKPTFGARRKGTNGGT